MVGDVAVDCMCGCCCGWACVVEKYIVLVFCGWGSVVVAEIYILFVSGAGVLWLVWLWLGCLIVHF